MGDSPMQGMQGKLSRAADVFNLQDKKSAGYHPIMLTIGLSVYSALCNLQQAVKYLTSSHLQYQA